MATDWSALEMEFVNGSMTYKELAEKHGLKEGTVRQRANRGKWIERRNALSHSVTQAAQARLSDTRTDELAKFNENDIRLAKAVQSMAEQALIAMRENQSPGFDPLDLMRVASSLASAQKVGRLALGATTENTGVSSPKGGPVESVSMTPKEFEAVARKVADEI